MHALAAVRHEIHSRDHIATSKYLREFNDAFRRYDSVLLPDQLEQKIFSADIVLVGDYHALPAAQHFTAELVEKCARKSPVVLAVEAILARDQRILDVWWRRQIEADELRRRLRFDREWGYPWEPFYELLNTARDHAEAIYGLDCMPRDDLRRIRSRDRHAAAKIREIRECHPKSTIVVLFGESHIAPHHLPRAVRELIPEDNILSVLQNTDALYWPALAEKAYAVSIGDDVVCVFNSSPLEKYESYRLCLEHWKSTSDDSQDFAPAIYNLIFSLARTLGFRLDSPRNGTQPKFLADSLPEVLSIADNAQIAEEAAGNKSCVYMPESNSFFIREFQMADAAEECMRFLHSACRGMTKVPEQGRPVEDALACFGRRLLCPELGNMDQEAKLGDLLYRAYVDGKISPAVLRRLLLARLNSSEEALRVLNQIETLAKY